MDLQIKDKLFLNFLKSKKMNNLMENFSGLAMSRMEMKKVTGGTCFSHQAGQIGFGGPHKNWSAASKTAGAGGNYCCDSGCKSASWFKR
jgi:hypothetical protein